MKFYLKMYLYNLFQLSLTVIVLLYSPSLSFKVFSMSLLLSPSLSLFLNLDLYPSLPFFLFLFQICSNSPATVRTIQGRYRPDGQKINLLPNFICIYQLNTIEVKKWLWIYLTVVIDPLPPWGYPRAICA